ncbi:uncharacterized protein Z519_11725 [Cladophialophora bantiana CBS 173.52]|uniref:DNA mismatch repair protein S5 domain-containing protein n=1 Tax=Cladophialophora bantiana (strain ATCC 10958 / CBS 173.52 / CDC B-1940 / NIH 8579) TaxID=1442370 RepID=A0A0D2EC96_CLAB1|nr:uncharacterized protein Z519_11725 [Cladophialophora bantiana CBS 173.52]KIW87751.1 hypothetical protein Z519_11725 [Cladophialophora bantiana CBS 173.52]
MPIEALPETTSRALTSSLVLTDARSVVKELVDNALDARATTISVEISNNALDVIQVKDNGTGIDVQDRQLLCKRGCTSKIRSLEDLDRLGGSSLGFRGEALASIVELSQAVVVTTRVDGEVVGTSIKYNASGMFSSSSASHPVGTTIRVQDFLMKIPVRKQTALKESMKTLQAIRSLLFSFAFARPEVRLSLKILKGKNDKINWTYAPTSTASITEVATKIVGKDIVIGCTAHDISSEDCDVDLDNGWRINALLLSAARGSANARNARQYISIDGRPVSTDRGTMREVAKSYKRHLQKTLSSSEGSSVSRPFLFMQILCPSGSYDVNVEPTKDEVLFARPDQLLSLVECLFTRAYPGVGEHTMDVLENAWTTPSRAMVPTSPQDTSRIGLDHAELAEGSVQPDNVPVALDAEEMLTRPSNTRNPFTIAAMTAQVKPKRMDTEQDRASSSMNTTALADEEEAEMFENIRTTVTGSRKPSAPPSSNSSLRPTLTPSAGLSMRRLVKASTATEDEQVGLSISDDSSSVTVARKSNLQTWLTPKSGFHQASGASVISPNIQAPNSPMNAPDVPDLRSRSHNSMLSPPFSSQTRRGWGPGQKPFKVPLRRQDQAESSGASSPTPPSSIRGHGQLSLQRGLPGVPAVSESGEDDGDDVHSNLQSQLERTTAGLERSPENGLLQPNSELDDIMDFEHRKKAAIAHQKRVVGVLNSTSLQEGVGRSRQPESSSAPLPLSGEEELVDGANIEDYGTRFGNSKSRALVPWTSNPHRNRYLKALKDLSHSHSQPEDEIPLETAEQSNLLNTQIPAGALKKPELPTDDPRAYFIRQQRKSRNRKIYRTKSSKLPLERTPPEWMTFNLVLTTNDFKDTKALSRKVQALGFSDAYITHDRAQHTDFDDLHASIDNKYGPVLQKMVKTMFRGKAEDGSELVPEDLKIVTSKLSES